MKSEKAKQHLSRWAMNPNSPIAQDQNYVWRDVSVIEAIELAEQEAEERMREKAIKVFECILYMPTKQLAEECGVSIDRICEDAGIDYCRQLFVKKMNEE